jgi:hypothetical protein
MPKSVWLNHDYIVSEANGDVQVLYQPHHNGSIFIADDDDDDDDHDRPVLPYGQLRFGETISVHSSNLPLHYVRAASEWIATTLNRISSPSAVPLSASTRWSNGLLGIIYSYYFD